MIDLGPLANEVLLPDARSFLDSDLGLHIGGDVIRASGATALLAIDPATQRTIGRLVEADDADVDRAVVAASKAFTSWSRMAPGTRADILERFAELVDARSGALGQVESLDEGKPTGDTSGYDVPQLSATLRYYASLARGASYRHELDAPGFRAYELRQPYGVCAFIVPWNAPLLLFGWGMAAVLAAGNTIVVKPASDASLSILYLARIAEEAGLPPGVLNVVTGGGPSTGMALARHEGIARMAFTGSPEAGRAVSAACGANLVPVKLELGGKGAAIVFDDVDVHDTALAVAGGLALNSGQVCCTPTRWIVQHDIFDEFVAVASGELGGMRLGHGLDPATRLGPLINERQRRRVLGLLDQGMAEGASMLLEGGGATVDGFEEGPFVSPAILVGEPSNVCAQTEIFGPIAFAMPFSSEDEAVAIANGTPYGLANAVWTADDSRADRLASELESGTVWIDCELEFSQGIRYGGWHRSGMGGGVLAADALDDYLRRKSVVRRAST